MMRTSGSIESCSPKRPMRDVLLKPLMEEEAKHPRLPERNQG
jgi:hypothetical protein